MLELKIRGRGGQGAQTAGDILAHMYFNQGKYVQAFSTYGGAVRGNPVSTFIRVDEKPIALRCDIEKPDVIVCFDSSLLDDSLLKGATTDTLVVINSSQPVDCFLPIGEFKFASIDGKAIAQANNLDRIVNSALVGAVVSYLNEIDVDEAAQAVARMSPVKVKENVQACIDGFWMAKQRGTLRGRCR